MSMWEAVRERGTEVVFRPGDVLLHHGDESGQCYAVLEGDLMVATSSSQGNTVILGHRGPGVVIGELSALDGAPRSATVRAQTDVRAVVLTAQQFEQLILDEPELALAQIKRLSEQLRQLTERFSIRGDELRMRVLHLLEMNVDASGDPVFRSTRGELANWIGATREAVTRTLRELEDEGIIQMGRGEVTLLGR